MQNTYNLYNLEAPFRNYLLAGNINPISIRNYLSDYRYFTGWMGKQKKHSALTGKLIEEYKSYLITSQLPLKTVNRRLSTLRKFCSFCISQGWMKENEAKQVQNVKSEAGVPNKMPDPLHEGQTSTLLINNFQKSLTKKGLLDDKINQYITDVNEFLSVINSH